jgi:hypothetical protein
LINGPCELSQEVLVGFGSSGRSNVKRPRFDDMVKFYLKVDWGPEKAAKAIRDMVTQTLKPSNPFRQCCILQLTEAQSSEITCKVDPRKRSEAKSMIIKAAYRSSVRGLKKQFS